MHIDNKGRQRGPKRQRKNTFTTHKKAEKRKQKHNLNIHPTMFENNSAAKNNRPVFICWTCFYNTNETWHRFLFKT